ncbi:hypothetical protein PDJAM_G00091920 [Pangasius djambal]|uniref:Uncharacterized protein n=1 Tax=Pangasius djambal TaxID=1691987 RepID=A0ACC5Z5X2_9TELE|nr:hypothetical protein [Pangasius djambal]
MFLGMWPKRGEINTPSAFRLYFGLFASVPLEEKRGQEGKQLMCDGYNACSLQGQSNFCFTASDVLCAM